MRVINTRWNDTMNVGPAAIDKLKPDHQAVMHKRMYDASMMLKQLVSALPQALASDDEARVRQVVRPAQQALTLAVTDMQRPDVDPNNPLLVALRKLQNELKQTK